MNSVSTQRPKPRRVLSPHLQIYRLPLTALLSITHRISGALLALGFIFGNLLLASAATNSRGFEALTGWLTQPVGRLFLAGWLLLFNYHMVHGVRHLLWDISLGFSRSKQTALGITEILAAGALTILMVFAPCWTGAGNNL